MADLFKTVLGSKAIMTSSQVFFWLMMLFTAHSNNCTTVANLIARNWHKSKLIWVLFIIIIIIVRGSKGMNQPHSLDPCTTVLECSGLCWLNFICSKKWPEYSLVLLCLLYYITYYWIQSFCIGLYRMLVIFCFPIHIINPDLAWNIMNLQLLPLRHIYFACWYF